MANSLINGPQVGETPPAAQPDEGVPTFGYHSDGRAQIFNLKPGDKLPAGWHDTPQEPKPLAGIVEDTAKDLEDHGNGS